MRGNKYAVVTVGVAIEEWSLATYRRAGEGGVGRIRIARCRRTDNAGEDLIPDSVGPSADAAVAHVKLLLRSVDDEAGLRIGDEASACELWTGTAVVLEGEVGAGDVYTAHGCRLRDSPEVG